MGEADLILDPPSPSSPLLLYSPPRISSPRLFVFGPFRAPSNPSTLHRNLHATPPPQLQLSPVQSNQSDGDVDIPRDSNSAFASPSQLPCAKDPPIRSDCTVRPNTQCHVSPRPWCFGGLIPVNAEVKRATCERALEMREGSWWSRFGARGKSREGLSLFFLSFFLNFFMFIFSEVGCLVSVEVQP